MSIAGAISFVWSEAESTVAFAGGTEQSHRKIEGGNIAIEATDKSKLAVRAGGISLSGGSSFGMGLSSGTVVSNNKVHAILGD